MKIHIIGGSGSGKSFAARRLSKIYNIKNYDLDDLFWDNTSNSYGVKMPLDNREKMLNDIISKKGWIIEGVYYKWLTESFERADYIFILKKPIFICQFRIIKRFIKRKLGIEKGKKETLKSLVALLRWIREYEKVTMVSILKTLKNYSNKVFIVKRSADIYEVIRRKSVSK